jgi:tryptophanyl-tRNA synthetase
MGMQDIPWGPKRYLRFVGRSWKAQNFEKVMVFVMDMEIHTLRSKKVSEVGQWVI